MIVVKEKDRGGPIVLKLDGPDGNAFRLLSIANQLAKALGLDEEFIRNEMTSGDYCHLVKTLNEYFGEYIILEMSDEYAKAQRLDELT